MPHYAAVYTLCSIKIADSGQSTCDLTTVNEKLNSLQLQHSSSICNTTEGIHSIYS